MKSIIIEVPRNGTVVQLMLRKGATAGQAVLVTSDEVEILLTNPEPAAPIPVKMPPSLNGGESPGPKIKFDDLDGILKRLRKLNPAKRTTAVNSIKAMFQFHAPISDEMANKVVDALSKRGDVIIDSNSKLQFT